MTGPRAPAPAIVAFVPDLLDRSRLLATAPDALLARSPADLATLALSSGATVAAVDLARPGALEAAAALAAAGTRVLGFAAHVDHDLLEAALAAGCQAVPRSRFFRSLGDLLRPSPGTET